MKKLILSFLLIAISIYTILGQNKPFRGNGIIRTITYSEIGYNKLNLLDLEGKIEIVIGPSHQVLIQIDDNIVNNIVFELNKIENELTISIKDNKNGRLYLENINAKIKITLPESSFIKHRGNSDVSISGISGKNFRFEHEGNGDVILVGSIDELEINKTGNGNVSAEKLNSKTAQINTIGNGDVYINASESFRAKGAGNGDVVQYGKGDSKIFSKLIGNGRIVKRTL
jgi:DUF4097 and DUF4098 domain-containing protein YvlB